MVSKENKIRQYMELVPVLLFLVNLIMYGNYMMSEYLGVTMIMELFYWIFEHTFDASLITIVCLFYISVRDKWRNLSKLCLYAITALWINNIPYVVLGYETGIYFFIFATIIYITVLILSLRVLTNR